MMTRQPLVSIILPTYNEKENITELISSIDSHITVPKEILVVDDDSPDGTANTVKNLLKRNPNIPARIIERKKDHGLVSSLNEGITQSKGEIIAWMDADFSHPPFVLNRLIASVLSGKADVAIASRFVSGGKQKHHAQGESMLGILAGTFLNLILKMILSSQITDFTSGFIALKKDLIKKHRLVGSYGEYFLDLTSYLTKINVKIIEIGYESPARIHGVSKTAPTFAALVKHGIGYLKTAFSLWKEK
jgi:glycosyltransferase involved in cell wall biosynthesis